MSLAHRARTFLHRDFWMAPVDGASLAVFRILFGAMMAVGLVRFAWMGWIERSFIDVEMFLKYPGFEWVPFPGPVGIYLLFVVAFVSSLAMLLGWRFRLAATVFFLSFSWIEFIDASNYLNHYYLVSILSLAQIFLPMNRVWSLDRQAGRVPAGDSVPFAAVALLRFQFCVVYLFAGLAKATPDWLFHAQPMSLWMSANVDLPLIGPLMLEPWVHMAASWAGFLYDSLIWIFLLIPGTRLAAYGLVIVFHGMTHLMFPIGMFPFLMTLGTLVFFSAAWPRRFVKFAAPVSNRRNEPWGWSRAATVFVFLFVPFQALFPLRNFAFYQGDMNWTEEGMRWSWRVMAREKNGQADFRVRETSTGREWLVPSGQYLARHQELELTGQPDLILQLAHHIHREFARQGRAVEVRAEAMASLNGRSPAPLIDSRVDLASVKETWAPKSWILAAPQEEPIRLGRSR